MIANSEILGNFTVKDIRTAYDNLNDGEILLIILTDYRDIYSIKISNTDVIDFEYYGLMGARPGSPAAKKTMTEVIISSDNAEFRFPLQGVLGIKIKESE